MYLSNYKQSTIQHFDCSKRDAIISSKFLHANFRLRPLSSPVTSIPSSSSSLALLSRKETEPLSLSLAVTRERISREGRFQSSPDSRLLSISTWGEGEEETAAGHRTIHAAGVSRCGPRPNEFARMLERGRSSGFLPSRGALSSICTSFASDRVPLFFGTRICGRRVASHTVISHEKRGRIPSQSDNQGLSRAISVIDEPLSNGNKRELRPSLFFFRCERMQHDVASVRRRTLCRIAW